VISADWHPDDERLLTRYVEGADAAVDHHIAWCVSCRRRLSELSVDLDAMYDGAAADAGDAFTPDRLAAQRRSVQQRLGAAVPARVLPFPGTAAGGRFWPFVHVAAAAILVAVSGAGLVRIAQIADTGTLVSIHTSAAQTGLPGVRAARDAVTDPALEDIEVALAQPRTAELRVLDALTPSVRDIGVPIR
jgi:hypothetical protein